MGGRGRTRGPRRFAGTGRFSYRWPPLAWAIVSVGLMGLSGVATGVSPTSPPPAPARAPSNDLPLPALPPTNSSPGACVIVACAPPASRALPSPSSGGLGTTPTNWYVANWSGEGMIRENPNDPKNLVSGGLYQAPSAANDTTTYLTSGVSGAFTSWDGGRSWTDQTLPASPDWTNPRSAQCGHIHLADTAIGFGPNNVVYYVDLSYGISSGTSCTNPLAGIGLYSTVSHDGGSTWGTPVAIRGTMAGTSVDKPWIAIDQSTGEAYVAYTDDNNGSGIWFVNSTDEGASWSDPIELTSNGRTGLGVELVVDPSGGVDATWIDESAGGIEFVRSTDHGSTFSSPSIVATPTTTYSSSSPDAFRSYTLPALGVDGAPGNAFTGTLFSVWQNGLGGRAGDPSVELSRSTDHGTTWSAPISVSSKITDQDYQPSVAVGSDGAVYVDWYGVNSVNGSYRLEAALSTDGGQSFAPEISVSDADSNPSTSATGADWWIGDYTDITADSTGAHPLWTDARATQGWYCSGTCLWGYVYNISFYTALLVNDSLSASIPVNLTVNGTVAGAGPWDLGLGASPALWLVGSTYDVSAPSTVLWNGSTYFFDYWYGSAGGTSLFSAGATVAGTVVGGEHLVACYSLPSAGTCHSPGAPGFLQVSATPSFARVTIDGVLQPAGVSTTPLPEAPGPHWVNASAPGYFPLNVSVRVSPGNMSWANLTLRAIQGTLSGTVSPTTAIVSVDGTAIAVGLDGTFSLPLLPGTYVVVASAPRYYTYTNGAVVVTSSNSTFLAITLAGLPGWINGSIAPASTATVTVNGAAVPVDPGTGAFSTRVVPGTYWVNGSATGYLPEGSGPRVLGPLGALTIDLALSAILGTLSGLTVPVGASVSVNGTDVATANGLFNLSLPPGTYPVAAAAPGFAPLHLSVPIRFNETTVVVLTLNASEGWIRGVVVPYLAVLEIDGQAVPLDPNGAFNVSEGPNPHHLRASAGGYLPSERTVTVSPGRATVLTITLAPSGAAGPPTEYLLPGLLVGALAVAAVVAVILSRRRRPPKAR